MARLSRRHLISRAGLLAGSLTLGLRPSAVWATCAAPALGTARVLRVGTQGGLAVGLKSYPRTLALADKEIVLTFDDGPLPATTSRVLAALACRNVQATFFMIGRNAKANPVWTQRVAEQGHSVACHTYSHPDLRRLSEPAGRDEIERGFAAINAALAGKAACAPFFRYPGFADTAALNAWMAGQDIGVFGADLWASDWDKMSPGEELALLMKRLDKARRGIVLLHDIQPRTAAMLPDFLSALQQGGWRVVHLVPGPGAAATIAAGPGWRSETDRINAMVRGKAGG
jgi:peptidoglycan-N-acetylglucosamine deacetylase